MGRNVFPNLMFFSHTCAVRLLLAVFWRLRVINRDRRPARGVIVAPNHLSYADPPVVGAAFPFKPVWFMAKRELFAHPLIGAYLRSLQAFPVDRGAADLRAFRTAVGVLRNGGSVVLFPQGTRHPVFSREQIKPGFALLARIGRADVLPVVLRNTDCMSRFRRIVVSVGYPVSWRQPEEAIVDQYAQRMGELLEHADER